MRTGPTRTTGGSGASTAKRVLTLLGFTLLAGYLLGKRRAERSWEAEREEPRDEGVTVEVQDGSTATVPGEPMIGEESEPGEEVPDAGEVRATPEADEVDEEEKAGDEEADVEDGGGSEQSEPEDDETEGAANEEEEAGPSDGDGDEE